MFMDVLGHDEAQAMWWLALIKRVPIREQCPGLPEPTLDTWRLAMSGRCMLCQRLGPAEVHHIERRGQVHHTERENWPENLMAVCRACHDGPVVNMPHARQLAHKWRKDAAGHATIDTLLDRWLRIKDPELKAPNRVTVEEVQAELRLIQ